MTREDFRLSLAQERRDQDLDELDAQVRADMDDALDRGHDHVVEDRIAQSAVEHVAWAYDQLDRAMGGEAS